MLIAQICGWLTTIPYNGVCKRTREARPSIQARVAHKRHYHDQSDSDSSRGQRRADLLYTEASSTEHKHKPCLPVIHVGDDDAQHTIVINQKLFQVRPSLSDFLHRAGAMSIRQLWFWIDAICIDQTDLDEKSAQVRKMNEVYSLARFVVVFPGPMDGHKSAFRVLKLWAIRQRIEKKTRKWRYDRELHDRRSMKALVPVLESLDNLVQTFVGPFLMLPYWQRMWIVQEITLAKDVQVLCHNRLIPWGRFDVSPFLFIHEDSGTIFRKRWTPLLMMSRSLNGQMKNEYPISLNSIWSMDYNSLDVFDLLSHVGCYGCKLVHDRIYAILGLISATQDFVVDYNRPIAHVTLDVIEKFPAGMCWSEFHGMTRTSLQEFVEKCEQLFLALDLVLSCFCYFCFQALHPAVDLKTRDIDTHTTSQNFDAGGEVDRFVWAAVSETQSRDWSLDSNADGHSWTDCIGCHKNVLGCARPLESSCKEECERGCERTARLWRDRLDDDNLLITLDHRYSGEPATFAIPVDSYRQLPEERLSRDER